MTKNAATRSHGKARRRWHATVAFQVPGCPGDFDWDGDADIDDAQVFTFCMLGPELDYTPTSFCYRGDTDGDADVDLADFAAFQAAFTGQL